MGIFVTLFFFLSLAAGLSQPPHAGAPRQFGVANQIYRITAEPIAFDNDDRHFNRIAGSDNGLNSVHFSADLRIQLAEARWLNKPPLFLFHRALLI